MIFIRYFGFILAILLTIILSAPFCILRPFNQKNNLVFTRICLFLAKYLMWMEIETIGADNTWKTHPAIVISNHQHNFDILIGDKFFDHKFAVIGKKQLGYIPLFGQMFVLAGNILLDRTQKKKALNALDDMLVKVVKKKLSLLIFPEGTRNTNRNLKDFKKGAFHMAKKANIPIIPISVSQYHSRISLFKKLKIKVIVHQAIKAEMVEQLSIEELITQSQNIIQAGVIQANETYS